MIKLLDTTDSLIDEKCSSDGRFIADNGLSSVYFCVHKRIRAIHEALNERLMDFIVVRKIYHHDV